MITFGTNPGMGIASLKIPTAGAMEGGMQLHTKIAQLYGL